MNYHDFKWQNINIFDFEWSLIIFDGPFGLFNVFGPIDEQGKGVRQLDFDNTNKQKSFLIIQI